MGTSKVKVGDKCLYLESASTLILVSIFLRAWQMCPVGLGFKHLQSAEHFRGGETHLILHLLFLPGREIRCRRIGPSCLPGAPPRASVAAPGRPPTFLQSSSQGCKRQRPWRLSLAPLSRGSGVHLATVNGSLTPLPPFLLPEVTPNLCWTTFDPLLGK